MLIDAHFHAFTRALPIAADARYQPQRDALFSDLQSQLQVHGVQRGVIVQPSFLGTDNSYLLQLCEHFPHILRGVAVVSPDISRSALARMHAQGVRGIRLNWIGQSDWPDTAAPVWRQLADNLQSLGMHVQLHVEGARLAQAAKRLEGWHVPLVIDHLGRPDGISDWQAHANLLEHLAHQLSAHGLFIKLSAMYRCGNAFHPLTQRLIQTLGASHLLWGSDWPFTQHESAQDYATQIRVFDDIVTDQETKKAIMQTAQSLYFS